MAKRTCLFFLTSALLCRTVSWAPHRSHEPGAGAGVWLHKRGQMCQKVPVSRSQNSEVLILRSTTRGQWRCHTFMHLDVNLCITSLGYRFVSTRIYLFVNVNSFLPIRHSHVCLSGNCWRVTPSSMCLMLSTSWAASTSSPRHWCLVSLWTRPLTSHRSSGMRYVCHNTTPLTGQFTPARCQRLRRPECRFMPEAFQPVVLDKSIFFISFLSDLWANPNAVPEGAVRV